MKLSAIAVLVPFIVALVFTAIAVVMPSTVAAAPQRRPARVQRDPLRVPVAGEQQRLGLRRTHGERALLRDRRRHRDARRPVRPAARGAGARREPGPSRARCPFTPGRSGRTRRCSSGCSTGVIVIIGALTFLPGLALGPIVEHLIHGRLF